MNKQSSKPPTRFYRGLSDFHPALYQHPTRDFPSTPEGLPAASGPAPRQVLDATDEETLPQWNCGLTWDIGNNMGVSIVMGSQYCNGWFL